MRAASASTACGRSGKKSPEVQERVKIKILKGTESDILADGSLDYPDSFLEQFDIIIASIHARHQNGFRANDGAACCARSNRPSSKSGAIRFGRLIPSRPPFACRMEEVLDAIAEARCAPSKSTAIRARLDLEPRWIRAARARGIKFVISTDAHSIDNLDNLPYGVAMARRGWLTRGEVLNTLDAKKFAQAVHP